MSERPWLERNGLIKSSLPLAVAVGLRSGLQATYFIVIVRALGAEGYGAFAGSIAVAAIAVPLSGLGLGNVLVREVARRPESFSRMWGTVLVTIGITGLLLTVIGAGFSVALLPEVPLGLIAFVCVSELLFARTIDAASQAFQGLERPYETAVLQWVPSVARLMAGVALFAWGKRDVVVWGGLYCVASALAAGYALWLVTATLGKPAVELAGTGRDLRDGIPFAIGLSAQNAYNDADKTMLASLSSLDAAGVYAAGYRLLDVVFTPVRAVLNVAYGRFFRQGALGPREAFGVARELIPAVTVYGILVALGVLGFAELAPVVLGTGFSETGDVLMWLAVLPLLRAWHYLVGDTLTGSGHHAFRSSVQVVVAVINVSLNLWLIPRYSWRGAACATLVSEGVLLVTVATALSLLWRRRVA